MPMPKRASVADYFAQLEDHQRPHLQQLRELSLATDPAAEEKLAWNKATVEAAGYDAGEGFIKLPYDREIPVELCRTLMQARIAEYEATGAGW